MARVPGGTKRHKAAKIGSERHKAAFHRLCRFFIFRPRGVRILFIRVKDAAKVSGSYIRNAVHVSA
jgi:hypothetical protein